MIIAYHRPTNLAAALELLADPLGKTVPLGGGTHLNKPGSPPLAVVDLQALGLDHLEKQGKTLLLGATATLQRILMWSEISAALVQALKTEATLNRRQISTLAGTIVRSDGRSPLVTTLLALDASLQLVPDEELVALGTFLPKRQEAYHGRLIARVSLPGNVRLNYQAIARTPVDLPIVCVAVAQWPSGRTRVALGGFGQMPFLAMDGPEPAGAAMAARNAYHEAADAWASAAFRADVAETLTSRALAELEGAG